MRPIYQVTGALRGHNGDCFQACLASLLDRKLDTVPNFFIDRKNGDPLSAPALQIIKTWLQGVGCGGYVEFGFNAKLPDVLAEIGLQSPDCYYILTGCTLDYRVHSVVCKGDRIVHDPATSPGHCILTKPCQDGYYRTGFLLYPTI